MELQPPAFDPPDEPGVAVRPDNSVAVRFDIGPADTFDAAARGLMASLREAEDRFPGWPRALYLSIEGHEGDAAGFSPDFYEFQQDFLFSSVAPFVTALVSPLTGPLVNPEPQRDDVPHRLNIGGDTRGHAGQVVPDAG